MGTPAVSGIRMTATSTTMVYTMTPSCWPSAPTAQYAVGWQRSHLHPRLRRTAAQTRIRTGSRTPMATPAVSGIRMTATSTTMVYTMTPSCWPSAPTAQYAVGWQRSHLHPRLRRTAAQTRIRTGSRTPMGTPAVSGIRMTAISTTMVYTMTPCCWPSAPTAQYAAGLSMCHQPTHQLHPASLQRVHHQPCHLLPPTFHYSVPVRHRHRRHCPGLPRRRHPHRLRRRPCRNALLHSCHHLRRHLHRRHPRPRLHMDARTVRPSTTNRLLWSTMEPVRSVVAPTAQILSTTIHLLHTPPAAWKSVQAVQTQPPTTFGIDETLTTAHASI